MWQWSWSLLWWREIGMQIPIRIWIRIEWNWKMFKKARYVLHKKWNVDLVYKLSSFKYYEFRLNRLLNPLISGGSCKCCGRKGRSWKCRGGKRRYGWHGIRIKYEYDSTSIPQNFIKRVLQKSFLNISKDKSMFFKIVLFTFYLYYLYCNIYWNILFE